MPVADAGPERSPLQGRQALEAAAMSLHERPLLGRLILRGAAADPEFASVVEAIAGPELPVQPNTVSAAGERLIFWLGPDEWLLQTPPGEEGALHAALARTFAGSHAAVVDVSDAHTTLRLSGTQARDVLAKGCPLDLHPAAFAVGRCAQTRLARTSVLLHLVDDRPTFDIQVRWSHAVYLFDWLADAGAEYL